MTDNDTGSSKPSLQLFRSTSVTKTSRKTHQHRPSISPPSSFHHSKPLPPSQSQNPPEYQQDSRKRMISPPSSWQRYTGQIVALLDSLLQNPSGPLLPHDQQGAGHAGAQSQKPTSWWARALKYRSVRLLFLFYIVFSIFLSLSHALHWFTTTAPQLDPRFGEGWRPQRTYDTGESYSLMDDMTMSLKMSKLFSKAFYDATKVTKPYWLKAMQMPESDDITLITTVTPSSWSDLERMAEYWKGPISATLHASTQDTSRLEAIRQAYANRPDLMLRADIHLLQTPGTPPPSVLLPRNVERNLARLLARTEFVCEMPSNMVSATDVRRTYKANQVAFGSLLRDGGMLVIPVFGAPQEDLTTDKIPYHKNMLLELVNDNKLGLIDPHWNMNEGPTDLAKWKEASTIYVVERYHYDYEPIVVESKTLQPWCSERFLDRRSACLLSNYLAGGELWVLPDDFVVRLPESDQSSLTDFDRVIEDRVYAKFYWEQCAHHARQLDALGLWKSARSEHVRKQCARIIQNWGKGLIGKPE